MFDPHHTRYSNRKYYTRKGQVIQAKRIDNPVGVEDRLVPMYKNYLLKNKLISSSDVPQSPPTYDSVFYSVDQSYTSIGDMAVTTAPTNVTNCAGIAIGVDPDAPSYWDVYIFYVYNLSFTIPANFAHKTWTAGTSLTGTFEIGADDTLGMSFPISGNTTTQQQWVNQVRFHKISRELVNFE